MAVASLTMVGMAEIAVGKGHDGFVCLGLGSCIGVCMLDNVANVAGMAHVMLPEKFAGRDEEKPGKFADTAVKELLCLMEKSGASQKRITVAMAGGAQVFKFGSGGADRLEIGRRNAEAVQRELSGLGLRAVAQDTGGSLGRTMALLVSTGFVTIRTASQGEKTLCNLRA